VIIHASTTRIPVAHYTFSRREHEFDPATKVWTVYFDPENGPPGSGSDGMILNFYGWDHSIDPQAIAQEWVRHAGEKQVIFKFQAPDDVTHQPAFFIVAEAMHLDRGYGYLDISKITSAGNGTYAVTYDRRFTGKDVDAIDKTMKEWLLTPEAHAVQKSIGTLSVDADWQQALTKSH
jgi:hypothetical protein